MPADPSRDRYENDCVGADDPVDRINVQASSAYIGDIWKISRGDSE